VILDRGFSFFFYPEDGGDTFLRNVGFYSIYMAPHPGRWNSPTESNILKTGTNRCNHALQEKKTNFYGY
jgi:hypothetical protein